MQRRGTLADVQGVVLGQLAVVPQTIAPVRDVAEVGLDVIESERAPIDVFLFHGYLVKWDGLWPAACLARQASIRTDEMLRTLAAGAA
ncbi:hypothetical protein D9M72_567880 [compost metagenome]